MSDDLATDLDALLDNALDDFELDPTPSPPPPPLQPPTSNMSSLIDELSLGEFSTVLDQLAKSMDKQEEQANEQPGLNTNEIEKNISKTLEVLAENAKKIEETASTDEGELLDQLMKEFENNNELQGMMEGMMKQIMSKEVLYEPMKEMKNKYPAWLAENKDKITQEKYQQYIKQYEYVQQICDRYEKEGDEAFPTVVQLMQQMQECGHPPMEIIHQLAPGVKFNEEGYPEFPEEGSPDKGQQCSIL